MEQKYLSKISGPLLDRMDLHVEETPVEFNELISVAKAEKSAVIRERVIQARARQSQRFSSNDAPHYNAQMSPNMVRATCRIEAAGQALIKKARERLGLSAWAYDRILKVSRTIADIEGSEEIHLEHLAEAIHYRSLDGDSWSG